MTFQSTESRKVRSQVSPQLCLQSNDGAWKLLSSWLRNGAEEVRKRSHCKHSRSTPLGKGIHFRQSTVHLRGMTTAHISTLYLTYFDIEHLLEAKSRWDHKVLSTTRIVSLKIKRAQQKKAETESQQVCCEQRGWAKLSLFFHDIPMGQHDVLVLHCAMPLLHELTHLRFPILVSGAQVLHVQATLTEPLLLLCHFSLDHD